MREGGREGGSEGGREGGREGVREGGRERVCVCVQINSTYWSWFRLTEDLILFLFLSEFALSFIDPAQEHTHDTYMYISCIIVVHVI